MTILPKSRNGDARALVRKLWQYCNVLRDDGLSYPDYVEQLTYLLFLKMSDEQSKSTIPAKYSWKSISALDTEQMHKHYGDVLSELGKEGGMLGLIFRNAKNKIRDPAKLRLLVVELIGQTEWTGLSDDLKGDAYEGLLEKNARDTKSGAGQYFTPRPLIDAIVECVDPKPGEVICDPACGTAGFLLSAHAHVRTKHGRLSRAQQRHLSTKAIRGVELVEEVARLATMNLLLHGIAGEADDELPISCDDSLKRTPSTTVDVVLTNPPFGIRGSVTYASGRKSAYADEELATVRPDFWVHTANKQLNFLQHVVALLKPGGRTAVVVPDNVLFEAGAAASIRRHLLTKCHMHAILRLPPGLFYAQGVKANVIFFDRPAKVLKPANRTIWIYDLRSDSRFTLKTNPLASRDLQDFVEQYKLARNASTATMPQSERSRTFSVGDILSTSDCKLDMIWGADINSHVSGSVTRLDEIAGQIADDLRDALKLIVGESSR